MKMSDLCHDEREGSCLSGMSHEYKENYASWGGKRGWLCFLWLLSRVRTEFGISETG